MICKLFSALQVSKVLGITAEILSDWDLVTYCRLNLLQRALTLCRMHLESIKRPPKGRSWTKSSFLLALFICSFFSSWSEAHTLSGWEDLVCYCLCRSLISSVQLLVFLSLSFLVCQERVFQDSLSLALHTLSRSKISFLCVCCLVSSASNSPFGSSFLVEMFVNIDANTGVTLFFVSCQMLATH